MRNSFRVLLLIAAAAVCAACKTEEISRGVYEGSKAYNESLKSTPREKNSTGELPSYEQYEKERRGGAVEQRQ